MRSLLCPRSTRSDVLSSANEDRIGVFILFIVLNPLSHSADVAAILSRNLTSFVMAGKLGGWNPVELVHLYFRVSMCNSDLLMSRMSAYLLTRDSSVPGPESSGLARNLNYEVNFAEDFRNLLNVTIKM